MKIVAAFKLLDVMSTVFCDNCGTSLEDSARFCRACGKPTPLSEAATKKFDEQPEFQTPTSRVGASPTMPAYLAPSELPAAPQTNDLRRTRQQRNLIIVVGLMAVMIFALAGLLVFLNFGPDRPPNIPGVPPPVTTPTPSVPPPVPPVPPPPPGTGGRTRIDPSLIYPGSRQTMSVEEGGGKSVLQLHSDDSAKRVADWYLARLKTTKKVSILGQTILQAEGVTVVITGADAGSEILITRGD